MTALSRTLRRACLTLLPLLALPAARRADGGPATGFGNLNRVEFTGPGISQQ